jgi:hypothetical protein
LPTFAKNHGSDHGLPVANRSAAPAQGNDEAEASAPLATLAHEVELLRAEKAALRHTLDELEGLLEEKMQAAQSTYARQQKQGALLEEKSEEIRELHLQLLECPATAGSRESNLSPREEELLALSQELEQERRQLRSDEEALTDQMREMELQMSRERAELARQRHELQRLHGEVVQELERASRNSSLRERLQPLQRRHQEILHREAARLPQEEPNATIPWTAMPRVPKRPPLVSPEPSPQAVQPVAAVAPATALPIKSAAAAPPAAAPPAATPPAATRSEAILTLLRSAAMTPPAPVSPAPEPTEAVAAAVREPVELPQSQAPAPSRQPPADDRDDLLERLFG